MASQQQPPISPQPQSEKSNKPRSRPPRRPKPRNGGDTRNGVEFTARCFYLPSLFKKKPEVHVQLTPRKSTREADESMSRSVTFLASASLSTWWPSSPSAAAPGNAAAAKAAAAAAAASTQGGGQRASVSSSSSHWRRSQSSRVAPRGAASASFSFPSSPGSASSCMSTPKLASGCQEEPVFDGLLEAREA